MSLEFELSHLHISGKIYKFNNYDAGIYKLVKYSRDNKELLTKGVM